MSVLRYSFFSLPIHCYSHEKYYQRHDEYVKKQTIEFARHSPVPLDELSEDTRASFEQLVWWPPWKFNDIVGFVEIGTDAGYEIAATIYLIGKCFPRNDRRRGRTREITYFGEVSSVPIRGRDNEAYLRAVDEIITRAKKIIKKRMKHLFLYLPPFEWSCLDFVKVHRQVRELDRCD